MKLKLDENLGSAGKRLVEADGHDVLTILDQKLSGATDERIFQVCCAEGRAIVTMDHDFGQTLRFPPENSAGIVIIESPGRLSKDRILKRLSEFALMLRTRPITGELWIVEPGRVRIRLRE